MSKINPLLEDDNKIFDPLATNESSGRSADGIVNRTDPIVRHDTKYRASTIVMPHSKQYDQTDFGIPGQSIEPTSVQGKNYPLIRIDNHIIFGAEQVIEFKLFNTDVIPRVEMVFVDVYQVISNMNMPGPNNTMSIRILENKDNIHRPIALDFYIIEFTRVDTLTFNIYAEFKCPPLEQIRVEQEVFHWPGNGCQSQLCKLPANEHPTTYELLHTIAEKCGLGFAATEHTKDVKDDRWRLLKGEKYKDVIRTAVETGGGTTDDSETPFPNIFDAWVDLYGNIVLVNLGWLFYEPINSPKELVSHLISGIPSSDDANEYTLNDCGLSYRILSNVVPKNMFNNMMFEDIEQNVNLSDGYNSGTITTLCVMSPDGTKSTDENGNEVDKSNTMDISQYYQVDNSISGLDISQYAFPVMVDGGFEAGRLSPTIKQKQIRKMFVSKMKTHTIRVKLLYMNFGLERGMLCTVMYFPNNGMSQLQKIHAAADHPLNKDGVMSADQIAYADEELHQTVTIDNIDQDISGLYYIDGVEFDFDSANEKIDQYLYLIKRGNVSGTYDNLFVGNDASEFMSPEYDKTTEDEANARTDMNNDIKNKIG